MDIKTRARESRLGSIGWHFQRATGRLDRAMTRALEPHGLTLQQFPIIMTAFEFPGLTQTDYGQRFQMPPYAISRAIDTLVDAGLLERRPDPASRRAHNIHPTEKGLAMAPALFDVVKTVNTDFAKALSAAERAELKALLGKLLD